MRGTSECLMKIKNYKLRIKQKGFTLMEVLIGTFLVLIVFLGIFAAYQLGLKVVGQSKYQITAAAIANGELEQIRNLSYDVIGVVGGFPDGILEASKIKNVNGIDYTINTRVDYIVDNADGLSSPEDTCPNDYKKIEVKVSWTDSLSGNIKLVTDISPETLAQECDEEGGILLIQVFDAYGAMVVSPLIEIKNPTTNQVIKTATPDDGSHFFSLSPDSYKVVITKSDYSASRTYGVEEVANPEKPHLIVLDGELTEASFSIDRLSSMIIETIGPEELGYPIISNAGFDLIGEKLIGTDINEDPVYKYSQYHITNESGQVTISNLEWDSYTFSPDNFNLIDPIEPVSLTPNENKAVSLVLQADNSLLITIQDLETGSPIFSVESRLIGPGYDVIQYTDEDGKTYYIPLESAVYNIEVNISGYDSYSGPISVSGDTTKVINLQRIE